MTKQDYMFCVDLFVEDLKEISEYTDTPWDDRASALAELLRGAFLESGEIPVFTASAAIGDWFQYIDMFLKLLDIIRRRRAA